MGTIRRPTGFDVESRASAGLKSPAVDHGLGARTVVSTGVVRLPYVSLINIVHARKKLWWLHAQTNGINGEGPQHLLHRLGGEYGPQWSASAAASAAGAEIAGPTAPMAT